MHAVLASRSASRIALLAGAGVPVDIDPADVDEDAIGAAFSNPSDRALALAKAKALRVSGRQPAGRVIIGGDQVCTLDDGSFIEKPRDRDDHLRMMLMMKGRTHTFWPAAAIVVDGAVRAEIRDSVRVTFRAFSEATAIAYVDGGEGRPCCGGYEIEHTGIQLVERIDGSIHAILGLPLLGLLAALRGHDVDGVSP
ncbi:MAG TPA: Maf family protein [Myxococcota bacterium]|jgi:septum formation protein